MKNLETQPVQFITEAQVNVTSRIKRGKTAKFDNRPDAEAYARQKGSYVYNLYYYVSGVGRNNDIKSFGYAVPN